jgi:16S rRNA (cytosine1402-N4)-methyltransferase
MHIPVMTAEVLASLRPQGGGLFVDCTVGLGGHTRALLEAGAGRVIGLDRDTDALEEARLTLAKWSDRVDLVHADYRSIADVLDRRNIARVDGALADLGVSSMQFDAAGRGFSFQRDEPLDMRMDRTGGETAAELVARSDEQELADAIFRYGEERFSRRIARAIVRARAQAPIATTGCLADIVAALRGSIPRRARFRRCGSGSTASSTGSIDSSRRRRAACVRARGWPSSPFTRSRTGSSSTRSVRWRTATRRSSPC